MSIACCGFGHRVLYRDIKNEMQMIVEYLVEKKGVTVFYTGGMGEFDDLFIKVVRQCKIKKGIQLILVMPYLTQEMQNRKEYYEEQFDEIIIPEICSTAYYKQAITLRNRWMIEQSEFVVAGVCRDFGGAYSALQYAERKGKEIIDAYN